MLACVALGTELALSCGRGRLVEVREERETAETLKERTALDPLLTKPKLNYSRTARRCNPNSAANPSVARLLLGNLRRKRCCRSCCLLRALLQECSRTTIVLPAPHPFCHDNNNNCFLSHLQHTKLPCAMCANSFQCPSLSYRNPALRFASRRPDAPSFICESFIYSTVVSMSRRVSNDTIWGS